jgi:hypothetical protein
MTEFYRKGYGLKRAVLSMMMNNIKENERGEGVHAVRQYIWER